MKATGIIRRIDDLGRVVIPKEIRRTMGIREGDPLEIYTDRGAVIFKPYQNDELKPMAVSIVNTLRSYSNTRASVYDRYGHKLAGNGADDIAMNAPSPFRTARCLSVLSASSWSILPRPPKCADRLNCSSNSQPTTSLKARGERNLALLLFSQTARPRSGRAVFVQFV